MGHELDKSYDHNAVEPKWYSYWEEKGCFAAKDHSDKPPFCLVIPPPNVTGALHMGHALTYAIQDALVRWKRMSGHNTLWLPGCDHAGIATQMLVERKLRSEGLDRLEMGRESFLSKVWEWKKLYHERITGQSRRLGISVDWARERFTLDEGLSRAVREAFVTLHEEGLLYRARRMVNWSPGIRTVLSDLEVEHKEVKGHFWHIAYPVVGEEGRTLVIATTRPETLLGDTAIAVHSSDDRYRDLIGRQVVLPLTGRTIPVIADDILADPEKGTGAVKVTPSHDPNDFQCAQRNDLPFIDIFHDDASMNDNVPEKYRGMDRFVCRKAVVEDLEAGGFLVAVEDHVHQVGHCQRSGVPIEPKVSRQWFVKMGPPEDPTSMAGAAIQAVKEGKIQFFPKHWTNEFYRWLEGIQDWCVSRQLWWGHRIPAWYCSDCGETTVSRTDPSCCAHCQSANIVQDEDVLDTWFSSGLWPFSTLGWPDKTPAMATFYPNAIMETGFDILFFWVARMIMMGVHLVGDVPFREVYLHAMVRDEHGQKMSKTKGNVVDPLDVSNEHGADALRFTLLAQTVQGRDINLSLPRIAGYRGFMNKIWNSARFVLMNLPEGEYGHPTQYLDRLEPEDRWILTRLQETISNVDKALREYRFNDYASVLYQFTWHELCDWYLELSKTSLYGEDEGRKQVNRSILLYVLDMVLRLMHPSIPYITEEIWQKLPARKGESLAEAAFPTPVAELTFPEETRRFSTVLEVIAAARAIRSENRVPPSAHVSLCIVPVGKDEETALEGGRPFIEKLVRTGHLTIGMDALRPEQSGAAVTPVASVYVELTGIVDIEAERDRLRKNIDKARKKAEQIAGRLNNPSFRERAPAEVVAEQQTRLDEANAEVSGLEEHLTSLV
jgi:valyl-tRNA synthetase